MSWLEIPAQTSLPAAAGSTSFRYVFRIMIGHLQSSRPAVGQRAARLPSWTFESNIHGSDQKVRAPSAVNKRACKTLGWVSETSGTEALRIFRNQRCHRIGFGWLSRYQTLFVNLFLLHPIHPHHHHDFCKILRLLLRALHRTINRIEETAGVCGAWCQ